MKIGQILESLKIYRPVRKMQLFLYNPNLLQENLMVFNDLRKTRRMIAGWETQIANYSISDQFFAIVSFTNMPFLAKAHALLATGMRMRGYRPLIICNSGSKLGRQYFAAFGLHDFVFWDQYLQHHSPAEEETNKITDEFLDKNPTVQDFKRWEVHGVAVGRLALSTMIRKQLQGRLDLADPIQFDVIRAWLNTTLSNLFAAEQLFHQYPIAKIAVRDAGYVPNGVIYEVAMQRDVDAFRFEHAQMMGQWMVKRYSRNNKGQALFSLSPSTWEKLRDISLSQEQDDELKRNFEARYNPNSDADLYKYQEGKKKFGPEQVRQLLELDPKKKTAVIFAHISWDANFFDGEDLFDDFEDWLVQTVRIACENPNLNWVVKLHPANVYKLKREGQAIVEESDLVALRKLGALPGHIKIMRADNPINTWSLFPVIDYGLTVRGTIGMELPCFGVPVVTAGTGRYSGYGFTIDPPDRQAYKECLLSLHEHPRLTNEEIDLARRHAYWVFLHRQATFDEISQMSTRVSKTPNHPLHHNLELSLKYLKEIKTAPKFQAFLDWANWSNEADFVLSSSLDLREI